MAKMGLSRQEAVKALIEAEDKLRRLGALAEVYGPGDGGSVVSLYWALKPYVRCSLERPKIPGTLTLLVPHPMPEPHSDLPRLALWRLDDFWIYGVLGTDDFHAGPEEISKKLSGAFLSTLPPTARYWVNDREVVEMPQWVDRYTDEERSVMGQALLLSDQWGHETITELCLVRNIGGHWTEGYPYRQREFLDTLTDKGRVGILRLLVWDAMVNP